MRVHSVLALPGDGVGPEVIGATRAVLDEVGTRHGFRIDWEQAAVGGVALDRYGVPLRDEDLERCARAHAVLLGAVGGPAWDAVERERRPEQALLRLRSELGLFANLRPVTVVPALLDASPVRPERLVGVDLLIVRELTGGLYFGRPSEIRTGSEGREAVDTLVYTEQEIRRVVELAFELARSRRRRVTSIDKANVLASSRLWRTVVDEVAASFPDVTVEHRLVDAAAMLLVQSPASFDVIVTENLFGDILSDEAAVLTGSLGMLPSASLSSRPATGGRRGMYEPVHGSAPDIAGLDRANPIGAILSGAMMLRWSLDEPAAADAVEAAVRGTLQAGHRTADLAPISAAIGTQAFAHLVAGALTSQTPERLATAGGNP